MRGLKKIGRKLLPSAYSRIRDLRWEAQAWIVERLQEQGPEKKAEWALTSLARGLTRKAVDSKKARVLFLAVESWPYHLLCQVVTAMRLRQRGHHVAFVVCKEDLPLCNMGNAQTKDARPCKWCIHKKEAYVERFFPTQPMGRESEEARAAVEIVASLDLEGCRRFTWADLPLGKLCEPTLMWYLCRALLKEDDALLYRRLLQGAIRVADRFPQHLDGEKPDCVVIFNGDFFAERIVREICRRKGIRVVTHELGYLPNTIFVALNETAAGGFVDDTYPAVANTPLTAQQRAKVRGFFEKRRQGPIGIGGKVFWPSIKTDIGEIKKDLGLDDRPLAVLFTNVTWDTAALGRDVAFDGLLSWVVETVRFFDTHPEWQLVIRCHPSEVRDTGRISMDRVEVMLPERLGKLPANVHLVASGSDISSYVLMDLCRCGLVYTSTTGLEIAAQGKPVIVAARTHYGCKGFTQDPKTKEEYFETLGALMSNPTTVTAEGQERLDRYAHHFFYDRMLPMGAVTLVPGTAIGHVQERSPSALRSGKYGGLEKFCDVIATGRPPAYHNKGD